MISDQRSAISLSLYFSISVSKQERYAWIRDSDDRPECFEGVVFSHGDEQRYRAVFFDMLESCCDTVASHVTTPQQSKICKLMEGCGAVQCNARDLTMQHPSRLMRVGKRTCPSKTIYYRGLETTEGALSTPRGAPRPAKGAPRTLHWNRPRTGGCMRCRSESDAVSRCGRLGEGMKRSRTSNTPNTPSRPACPTASPDTN